jgi:FKBP-type peptidyl-prolyl cis-trans isomerase (trigger factor)
MAEKSLKAEFAMAQIIKDSGITVTDTEIEETAKASGDPQVMENLKDPTTKWYIKSIIEKNKLLASIMDELEIPYKNHEEEEKKADSKDKEKK